MARWKQKRWSILWAALAGLGWQLGLVPGGGFPGMAVAAGPATDAGPGRVVPRYQASQVLLRPADVEGANYFMTPTLVRVSEREVLVFFKRGTSHGWEEEAVCEMMRFDTVDNRVLERRTIGRVAQRKFQLTLGNVFGDGRLKLFTDLQHTGHDGRHYRNGMLTAASTDGGATFGPWRPVGLVEGVEYGYPLDTIVEGNTAYLLAMTFGYRPGDRWSVDVLRSTDHGQTWSFVRDLTAQFGGFRINESGFARYRDGFLVATRGYDRAVRLYRTDADFRVLQSVNLTETCPYVHDYWGWPRVFAKDGRYYLLGRNWTDAPVKKITERPAIFPGIPENQQLCLLRFDPDSLAVERVVVLDNPDGRLPVVDGYYAAPYWQAREGRLWFNTIIYRAIGLTQPEIVRLEFDWSEVR